MTNAPDSSGISTIADRVAKKLPAFSVRSVACPLMYVSPPLPGSGLSLSASRRYVPENYFVGSNPMVRDFRTKRVSTSTSAFTASQAPLLRVVTGGPLERDELLRLVSLGDRSAFTALYDDLSSAVFGLVRRVVCDPAQSEEVTQEVFVEVWRIAHRFDPTRGNAKTWILTIAHRRAVDRVRSEQTQRNRIEQLSQAPAAVEPDENVASLDRQVVQEALAHLTDIQRQAIELAYYRGLTQSQIAELLDVPLGTVKTRIRDGLIRLRDALGEGS